MTEFGLLEQESSRKSVVSPDPAGSAPRASKRIVITDDDAGVLEVMSDWLTAAGHEVVSFNEFEAAKAYLFMHKPDVLITDVRLGAFNGVQLAMLANRDTPGTIAIVLTGFDDPVIRKEATMAGALYFVKPVKLEQLLDIIR